MIVSRIFDKHGKYFRVFDHCRCQLFVWVCKITLLIGLIRSFRWKCFKISNVHGLYYRGTSLMGFWFLKQEVIFEDIAGSLLFWSNWATCFLSGMTAWASHHEDMFLFHFHDPWTGLKPRKSLNHHSSVFSTFCVIPTKFPSPQAFSKRIGYLSYSFISFIIIYRFSFFFGLSSTSKHDLI